LITVLAGGTGSIKIIRGLSAITSKIAIIANVGDNFWFQGLYICPDVDTSLYGLKGILDRERGWGIRNDSFTFIDTLKRLGEENWFKIGDKDLVTHIIRTRLLREGLSLYQVIKKITKLYDIKHNVIPATDTPIETRIITDRGDINIQEFWVKYKGKPRVYDVYYKNVENAKISENVTKLLRHSKSIIIAPANPISSIGPILAIKPIQDELISRRKKVLAISPIIGNKPFSGPAAKYLESKRIEISSLGIAKFYSRFVSKLVIHKTDHLLSELILDIGVQPYITNIIMRGPREEVNLAKYILAI
jgi:LPPG:FO 2-phospho-L-lactate transferase